MKIKVIAILLVVLVSGVILGCADIGGQDNQVGPGEEQVDNGTDSDDLGDDTDSNLSQEEIDELMDYLYQENYGNGVAVDVVWSTVELYTVTGNSELIEEYQLDTYHVFDIAMTTHSGDLRGYSYATNVVLIVDGKEYLPQDVNILSNDSHHPWAMAMFSKEDASGPIINDDTQTVILEIRDLAGVELREFRWEIGK